MTDGVHFGELQGSLVQPENNLSLDLNQDANAPVRPIHYGQRAITEMLIGPWYLDEFGNPTREIKARD